MNSVAGSAVEGVGATRAGKVRAPNLRQQMRKGSKVEGNGQTIARTSDDGGDFPGETPGEAVTIRGGGCSEPYRENSKMRRES